MTAAPSTEWESTLQKFGIGPKEAEITEDKIIEMIEEKVESSHEQGLDSKTLEELDELEDDIDDEEERIIERIRAQRLAEWRAKLSRDKFGDVTDVSKSDWKEQVNEAGQDVFVVVHIYERGNLMCNLINDAIVKLALKFKHVKFVRGLSETCIPNYPNKNIPTFIIYKNGELVTQWIGKSEFGGNKFSIEYLEWKLSQLDIVESKIQKNPIANDLEVNSSGILIGRRKRTESEEDDNDW